MDVVKTFAQCDSLRLNLVIVAASDVRGYISSRDYWAHGICASKPVGQLLMNLSIGALAEQLGYPLAAGFQVPMRGMIDGTDASGNPIVLWTVNAQLGQQFDDTVVESVEGAIRTSLISRIPSEKSSICGPDRTYLINLNSVGAATDIIKIKVHKTILGVDYPDTLTIENIALAAEAGLDFDLAIHIRQPTASSCSSLTKVEGRNMTLHAIASGTQASLVDSYAWTVSGATALTALDTWELMIKLPSPPQLVTISLSATAAGATVSTQSQFIPLARDVAAKTEALMMLVCQIRHEILRNPFFNPLSDPIRDFPPEVVFSMLGSIGSSAQRVAVIAERISATSNPVRK